MGALAPQLHGESQPTHIRPEADIWTHRQLQAVRDVGFSLGVPESRLAALHPKRR
jgi:hypothetical protein